MYGNKVNIKRNRLIAFLLAFFCFLLCGCGMERPGYGSTTAPAGSAELPGGSSFAVHFIDVGQGDASLILCDGEAMLIDGGNTDKSSTVYTYLKKQGIDRLDYLVCTHPDADHVGGLSGALEYATAETVWCPVESYSSKAFESFRTRVEKQGRKLVKPAVGIAVSLGSATVTVLAPIGDYKDSNNQSIVLRVVYGQTSFLFTGDAELESERDMCDRYGEQGLKSTVLKVGHHGSDTSTSIRFLSDIMPRYAVISCGKDNKYGHPTEQTLSRLSQAGATVYRTDLQGDILCESNGETVTFRTARNSDATVAPSTEHSSAPAEYAYVGNLNTKKFHKPTCASVPGEKNAIWFTSRKEAVENGYIPCGTCKP